MKKIFKSYMSLLLCLLAGCSSAQDEPERIFKEFIKAGYAKDMETAKSLAHSSYAEFFDMMKDAKKQEGADTVDRIDYNSLRFDLIGEGGVMVYKNNGKDEYVFFVKEDEQWKLDPFGSAGNYGLGAIIVELDVVNDEDESATFVMDVNYKLGDLELTRRFEDNFDEFFGMTSFYATDIISLDLKINPGNTPVKLKIDKVEDPQSEDRITLVPEFELTEGEFQYSPK